MIDIYNRQRALHLATPAESIVVGLGGTGTWTALFLAMSGVQTLHLMDFDILETSNLNRLPYTEDELGMSKVSAASSLLKRLRPAVNIMAYQEASSLTLDMAILSSTGPTVIFDCTDKIRIQRMLYGYSVAKSIPYIRVGYDGTHMTIADYVTPFSTMEDDEGGYSVVASWVCPAAVAAGIAVSKVMLKTNQDISLDIREIGARPQPTTPPQPTAPRVMTQAASGMAERTADGRIILTITTEAQKDMLLAMFDCAQGRTLVQYYESRGAMLDSTAKSALWQALRDVHSFTTI